MFTLLYNNSDKFSILQSLASEMAPGQIRYVSLVC